MKTLGEWIVIGLFGVSALTIIYEGLIEKHINSKTRGPSDVLAGCLALVICAFAAYGLWTR